MLDNFLSVWENHPHTLKVGAELLVFLEQTPSSYNDSAPLHCTFGLA